MRVAHDVAPLAPRQPVTITLPFSASASPIASSDSATRAVDEAAGVHDDEVGARVVGGDRRSPRRGAGVRMCSESTSAFGQPSETKPIFGAWVLVAAFGTVLVGVATARRGRYCATHDRKRQRPLPGRGRRPTIQ